VQPTIEARTVATGQNLKVKAGEIMEVYYDPQQKKKIYTPFPDFNGTLQLKAIFPGIYQTVQINPEEITWDDSKEKEIDLYTGDVIVEKKIPVQNGKYLATTLTVPDGIREGQAHIECYAESANATAVGGASFSVFVPKILDIQAKLITDKDFSVSVQVSDELQNKGIKSVILEWRDPLKYNWQEVAMQPDSGRDTGWYTIPSALTIPKSGEAVRYQISVFDIDGYEAISDILEFRPFVLPNLKSVRVQSSSESLIYYAFSKSKKVWELNVDIEQTEPFDLTQDVEIAFYNGNPDRDKDGIIDHGVVELGRVSISPVAWQSRPKLVDESMPRAFKQDPLNTNPIVTAKIQHEFTFGQYEVYIWVDPDNKIKEISKDDNIGYGQLMVESTIIGDADKRIFSRDNVLNLRFPKSSIAQPKILTLSKVNSDNQVSEAIQQDSLNRIKLANEGNAYHVVLNSEPNTQLLQPITAEVSYDVAAIKRRIRTDLALDEILQLTADQIEAINSGFQLQATEIGLYIWRDDLQKWLRQPTEVIKTADGHIQIETAISSPSTRNQSDRVISSVKVDQNGAKVGNWIVMFTSATTYRLMVREGSRPLEVVDPNRIFGKAEENTNFKDGLAITFTPGQDKFQFGDVLTFQVLKSNLQEGTAIRYHALSFQDDNDGSGVLQYIQIGRKANVPEDQWVIFFLDADTFQIEGKQTGILAGTGIVGKPYSNIDLGLHLQINVGDTEFSSGDRFRFKTQPVGRVQAELSQLGTIALMRSDDTISPDIQLTISKQNFINGDPVSKEPIIQATISDSNGVNPDSIQLEFSRNSRDFDTILETNYDLSYHQGTNQIILNYLSPQLDPGVYQIRLTARDLDGNQSDKKTEFQVLKNFQMLKVMNYPNPFKRNTTITCELTMPADEMIVKIYTISGRMIWREEVDANAGFVMIPWDGRDSDGKKISNGVYYCKIHSKVGDKEENKIIKMMKLE
ncbi:TPA: T9SS type A sorting domain-containing protein, partial [Candidatus Poribacteria bacterium]|nr:T9SS type A sorting domain-containing protein [Candidatus Poribacteria bacterium]